MHKKNIFYKFIQLFKKLTVFDYLLFGFCVLVVIVFSFLLFRKSTFINATIKVGENSVFYEPWNTSLIDISGSKDWFGSSLYRGQTERDGLGRSVAEVLSVYSYNKTSIKKTVFLNMRLKVVYNRATDTYTYKGVPVLIGSKLKLNLDSVYLEGMVTSVNEQPNFENRKKIIIEAEIRDESELFSGSIGTKSYVAEAIKEGDTVTDGNGDAIIKILKKTVQPSLKTVTTSDGRVFQAPDPVVKDVLLDMEIYVFENADGYFLMDDIPIRIDEQISVSTPLYTIFPIVTKIVTD